MKTIAIIPSGGIGSRVGETLPKQYLKVKGKEIIAYTLDTFQKCSEIDEIIIAAQSSYFPLLNSIKERYGFDKISNIIEGGKSRQDSVYNALKSIPPNQHSIISVHDAARPLLQESILLDTIKAANEFGASVAAINARDTLCNGSEFVDNYLNRDEVYYIQTPQTFKYEIIWKAFEKANNENFLGTDESMLVKNLGVDVKIVEGSLFNFKITTKDDLKLFDNIL